MPLVIDLKPHEKIIVGEAVITNDKHRTRLHIDGEVAILREKDILRESDATTPCRKIYLTLQLMYLSSHPQKLHKIYFTILRDIVKAAPSTSRFFMAINEHILGGSFYRALKAAKDLIDYEDQLMNSFRTGS